MNTHENLLKEIAQINKEFEHSFVNKIQQISPNDFLFVFSKNKGQSLLISVNLTIPFIKIIDKKFSQNNISTFFNILKQKLNNAIFLEATSLNDDNILNLQFIKTNDLYEKINYCLVAELFKSNANLILLENNKIIAAFKYHSLDTNHPILNNINYVFPNKSLTFKEFDEIEQTKVIEYYKNIDSIYLKEKYKNLITLLKRKKKSLSKKLIALQKDHDEAKEAYKYKEYGDYLKIYLNDINRGDKELKIDDDIIIPLKETLSPTQNLERFYKIYKKSKITLGTTEKYILQTKDDIDYIDNILNTIHLFDENDFDELVAELADNKFIKISSKKQIKKVKEASKPYYITCENIRVAYGKNNIQNDNLTFRVASNKDWFLHIKNNHGSHVVILDSNPSDKVIQLACELVIYLSKQEDGEVIFTRIGNCKKGSTLGLVKFNKYETYHINKISDELKNLVNNSNRF